MCDSLKHILTFSKCPSVDVVKLRTHTLVTPLALHCHLVAQNISAVTGQLINLFLVVPLSYLVCKDVQLCWLEGYMQLHVHYLCRHLHCHPSRDLPLQVSAVHLCRNTFSECVCVVKLLSVQEKGTSHSRSAFLSQGSYTARGSIR